MKRLVDLVGASFGLLISAPVTLLFMVLVWLQDRATPLYIAPRVGRDGRVFQMIKLRSMLVGAAASGVDSTASDDARITWVGQLVRRYKLDELTQLWNVLCGEMSLVGPRPELERAVLTYTDAERCLLALRPGITDFSSIVFADEAEILAGADDPDLRYRQLIRPWKSRLGLFYIEHRSLAVDLALIGLTLVTLVDRSSALRGTSRLLAALGASDQLVKIAARETRLAPYPLPGRMSATMSPARTARV